MPLRADADDESVGLDVTQHGEEAYVQSSGSSAVVHRAPAEESPMVGAVAPVMH